ncbi:MAG: hypothetical protein E7660_01150 [Ruminococcaceae bacterium]|nr:hypothetical protein [Oscillospiraceae bacterium]
MKNLIEKLSSLDKKAYIIIGISAAVLVALIVTVCVLAGGRDGEPEETDEPKLSQTDTAEKEPLYEFEFGDAAVDPENLDEEGEAGAALDATSLPSKSKRVNAVDVSKWQGKIDWKKVKASGIDVAFIRIGYRGENGKLYKDDNADYNIQEADKAGVLVGVYFFSTAINKAEALEEANFTLDAIKGYSISYPVVYDCEGYKNSSSRMSALSPEARTDNAEAFLDTLKKAGYDVMFYGSKNDIETNSYWQMSRIAGKYKVWVAQYTTPSYPEKDAPDYTGHDAWQYTNKGTVSGIDGYVDMAVCYFENVKSSPKDKSYVPTKAEAPLTDEEKIYSHANDKVTAKSLTNLRTKATTKSDVVAALKNGEVVERIGIGSNGWSKLSYYGQTVYAITSYLTTDLDGSGKEQVPEKDIVHDNLFEPKHDKVTAKNEVNLRSLPTTDSVVVGTLKKGVYLERTATSNKGWSRLIYNGEAVYAITSYLTTTVGGDSSDTEKEETTKPVSDGFKAVSEKVTAKQATNLRTAPSTVNSEVVYTLKNGEFIERIGVHTNGWSKLIYKGQTVYAITSYLTTEVPETTTAPETTKTPETTEAETTAETTEVEETETETSDVTE